MRITLDVGAEMYGKIKDFAEKDAVIKGNVSAAVRLACVHFFNQPHNYSYEKKCLAAACGAENLSADRG